MSEKEIRSLERNVSAYFDYVERLLEDETLLGMQDFATSIDEFLKFNRYEILEDKGRISHKAAKEKAMGEYREFNKHPKITSDFDKVITVSEYKNYVLAFLFYRYLSENQAR